MQTSDRFILHYRETTLIKHRNNCESRSSFPQRCTTEQSHFPRARREILQVKWPVAPRRGVRMHRCAMPGLVLQLVGILGHCSSGFEFEPRPRAPTMSKGSHCSNKPSSVRNVKTSVEISGARWGTLRRAKLFAILLCGIFHRHRCLITLYPSQPTIPEICN